VVISDIRRTRKGYYALFSGEQFLLSCDEVLLEQRGLEIGLELSQEEFDELREECTAGRAVQKALRLLAVHSRSTGELRERLRADFDEYTADYAVDRMAGYGYLNDADYAQQYARELFDRRLMSLKAARSKMFEKKLDASLIEETLEGYRESELDRITSLLERKYDRDDPSSVRKLQMRGFSPRDIRQAMRLPDCPEAEESWQ